MAKKIDFGAKRSISTGHANLDDWVLDKPPQSREPSKRLTIDVPIRLHKRIKSQCALQNLVMADVIRDILEQQFPAPGGEGGAS